MCAQCHHWTRSVMCFWSRGSIQQLIVGAMLSIFFMVVAITIRPFQSRFNNNFKTVTDIAIIATFMLAILLSDRVDKRLEPAWLGREELDSTLLLANLGLPILCIVFEVGLQAIDEEEEVDRYTEIGGLRWPFARWDGHGGQFRGAGKNDDARLATLRRELEEQVDFETLQGRALNISKEQLRLCHKSQQPKDALVELVVWQAGLEGKGWGCWSGQPVGTTRAAVLDQGTIRRTERLTKQQRGKAPALRDQNIFDEEEAENPLAYAPDDLGKIDVEE
jgi:hypothetical protein